MSGIGDWIADVFTGGIAGVEKDKSLRLKAAGSWDAGSAGDEDYKKYVLDVFRRHGIKEGDLEAAWGRAVNRGQKPGPLDPTEAFAASQKMQGAELTAAAGQGFGGLFGFGVNFGATSGFNRGGQNIAAPLQPGASAIPKIPTIPGIPDLLGGK